MQEVNKNLETLNYETQPVIEPELLSLAQISGYTSLEKQVNYPDGTFGVLVSVNSEYNNGVYILHELSDHTLVLETVVPSTADKSELIRHTVGDITTYVEGLDTSHLEVYDLMEITSYVVSNSIIRPLMELRNVPLQHQEQFMSMYMTRFLANVARFHMGDKDLREEQINSEPYYLKELLVNPEAMKAHIKKTQEERE